jgi:hypothetical protein
MGLLTALAGVPLQRLHRARRAVMAASGAVSIALGVLWAGAAVSG